jgi:serine/threonine protein kinase
MAVLEELTNQILDEKYRIEKKLGQGGMGAVYLATHLGTKRPVALKVIAPQFLAHPELVERFKREAEAAGRLRHPNVVNVTDFGFAPIGEERLAYMVMEYLNGCTLGEVLAEEKQLPLSWVVDIVEQVCLAIDLAHRQGIIHRDLKPDNIWLEPNGRGGYTIKVLDFGLAKLRDVAPSDSAALPAVAGQSNAFMPFVSEKNSGALSAVTAIQSSDIDSESPTQIQPAEVADRGKIEGSITRIGTMLGTPLYMSPEQCRGDAIDARSDIYSLGVITYQMLAGRTPFSGDICALVKQHTEVSPQPLKLSRGIPKSVSTLIMSALAKNPAERPATAAAFASALRARSENTGTLLRQAITLYTDHFPTFIGISLLGHIPWLVVRLLELITIPTSIYLLWRSVFAPGFIFFYLLSNLFANVINAGVVVPVVVQVLLAPLRPIRIVPAFSALKKQLRAFVATSILFYGVVVLLLITSFVPFLLIFFLDLDMKNSIYFSPFWGARIHVNVTVVAIMFPFAVKILTDYSLYPPVVIIEGKSGNKALAISKLLVARSPLTALIISLLYIFVHFLLGTLGDAGSYLIVGGLSETIREFFIMVFSILINPLIAVAFALLYLKTRQAGGETLKQVLGQFEEETPRSKWQLRMRENTNIG